MTGSQIIILFLWAAKATPAQDKTSEGTPSQPSRSPCRDMALRALTTYQKCGPNLARAG